jgi:general secretion pathway protein F
VIGEASSKPYGLGRVGERPWWQFERRMGLASLSEFVTDLHALTHSGRRLPDALMILAEEPGYRALSDWALTVSTAWAEGHKLSVPGAQNELGLLSDFLEAGREHARLTDMLAIAEDIFHRRLTASKAISQALAYPIALICLGAVAFLILCGFVAPELLGLFGASQTPFAIRMMAGAGEMMTQIAPFLFMGVAVGLLGLLWSSRSPVGKKWLIRSTRRLPVIGSTLRGFDEVAFLQLWATYMGVGHGVDRALRSLPPLVPPALERFHYRLIQRLRDGSSLSGAVQRENSVSEAFKRAVRLGEANTDLEPSLLRAADLLQERALSALRRKLAVLAPATIVTIAATTGWMMISLMQALTALGGDL